MAMIVFNASTLLLISQSLLCSFVCFLLLPLHFCYVYEDLLRIVLSLATGFLHNANQTIDFSQNSLHFHPFPPNIHFHLDFQSTEGLCLPKQSRRLIGHLVSG